MSLAQTDNGRRFAVLFLSIRVGDRALPLAWMVASGTANLGFEGQLQILEPVSAWLPEGVKVMLLADRFYSSVKLFEWLKAHHWAYRLRLKANFLVDRGVGDLITTGALTVGQSERYESNISLFQSALMTHLGILSS